MSKLIQGIKHLFFAAVFFSIGVGLCAILLAPQQTVQVFETVVRPEKTAFGQKNALYILLLGLDYSYDSKAQRHTKDARTDTLMLLRVEPRAKSMSLLSIPRDLLVPLAGPAGGYDKINAAYSQGGASVTRKTVERLLNLSIDHVVVVKSDVVADLVDLLGGVPVTVEKAMDYDDHWAKLHIHLKPGKQRLDGQQAVGYLRFRNDEEGDFGRIRRQQQFMTALIRELKSPRHLPKYRQLAETVSAQMQTDLSIEQMASLASLYRSFPLDQIVKGRLEVADYMENGIAYLILVEGEPQKTLRQVFPPLPDARLATIPVLIEDYRQGERRQLRFTSRFEKGGFGEIRMSTPGKEGRTVDQTSLLITGDSPAAEKALPALFPGLPIYKKSSSSPPRVTLRLRHEDDIL